MFTAEHKSQRVEMIQCPPNDDLVNKMWYVHTVDYYSAKKKKSMKYNNVNVPNATELTV